MTSEALESIDDVSLVISSSIRKRTLGLRPGEKFIRRTFCSVSYDKVKPTTCLSTFLEQADTYFEYIAGSIGATVVAHEWKLIQTNSEQDECPVLKNHFGIKSAFLSAEVEYVPGEQIKLADNSEYFFDLSDKLRDSALDFLEENGWYIGDASYPHQFMRNSTGYDDKLTLVDIEPRIVDFEV